jgi:beta-galactosidase
MKTALIPAMIVAAPALALAALPVAVSAPSGRQTISFDQDWRFHRGDLPGGQAVQLDDSSWRRLDVPHDWSIEGRFNPRSPAGDGGGYLDGGIGWYRKTFAAPPGAKGRRVRIQFDGAYMDSDVWLNEQHLGRHPYGFTGFGYDLTALLRPDRPNVLAVRLNVTQPCSRWYSGAGIYRHVWLSVADPVHVAGGGTWVTTPKVAAEAASVRVRTRVANQGSSAADVRLETTVLDPRGAEAARAEAAGAIAPGAESAFDQTLAVGRPALWSIDTPRMYRVVSRVKVGGRVADCHATSFGIRTFEFTRDRGFFLNGRQVPLQGVCNHHDLGCLGAAVHRRGIERQLEILKGMGCNAIRTSHNPPAPELLDLCDRMGFLVMDEAFDEWKAAKTPFGYSRFFDQWSERDLVSMLRRDRNHPCIVMWSIGNEINEQGSRDGYAMSQRLADICRREDPTRPTISACNDPGGADRTGFAQPLDLLGINYNLGAYRQFRGRYALVASETASALSTRCEYNLVPGPEGQLRIQTQYRHQVTSYDRGAPPWGCTAETGLAAMIHAPWVAGEFVWTGFDYIGEPTPYAWPARSSYFGIVDLCGFPKDRYYFYRSRWRPEPLVHLLPHWDWPGYEGRAIPVWCVTNCDSAELLLDGRSLGEKRLDRGKTFHVEWSVPYAAGTLKAVGKNGGRVVCADEIRTPGRPKRLVLRADRSRIAADGQDLSFVQVRVTDAGGVVCPRADHLVRFRVEGPCTIAGVDNGDPTSHEPFQADRHMVFHGLGLAVLKATRSSGRIVLKAGAEGLDPAAIALESGSAPQQ